MSTATIPVDIKDMFESPHSWGGDVIQDLRLRLRNRTNREEITRSIDAKFAEEKEEKSPFEELDVQLPAETKIRRAIEHVRKNQSLPYAERLANRLQWLLEASLEDPDEIGIKPESLSSFLEFIKSIDGLKYPDIVLSPTENIVVRWREDKNRNLCIEFLPDHETTRFVVFAPDPLHTLRSCGSVPINKLWDTLKPYQVERWVINDR